MKEHALWYARRGWKVLPLRVGNKTPVLAGGVHSASSDLEQVEEWWNENPNYNIGIATGLASGIVVLDFDDLDSMRACRDQGLLEPTLAARTPRGFHLYYQAPEGGLKNSASKLARGVDTRGDGGYVIAPTSVTVVGTMHEWRNELDPAPLPEWVLERLNAPKQESGDTPFAGRRRGTEARSSTLCRHACCKLKRVSATIRSFVRRFASLN